jgi:hypothetical protein
MWKAALAGLMLATTGITFVQAEEHQYGAYESTQPGQRVPTVTAGNIARLKAALKLTASQQKYWPAVESALRRVGRREASASDKGWAKRAGAAVGQADAVRRVAAAARPLISVLDEKQKESGMRVIRALGFSSLASAL